jgi:hypothetical protein
MRSWPPEVEAISCALERGGNVAVCDHGNGDVRGEQGGRGWGAGAGVDWLGKRRWRIGLFG